MIKYKDALTVVIIVIALIIGLVAVGMISNTLAPELLDDSVRDITYTETEDFESPDINGSDPDSLANSASTYSWMYTYNEVDWGEYDDIDNRTTMPLATAGEQCYWVYGNNSDSLSRFVFKDADNETCFRMDYFEMCAKIDNSTNEETNISFFNCEEEILMTVFLRTYDDGESRIVVTNNAGTELINTTIDNNTWYKGRIDADYTTSPYTYTFTAYKENIAGIFSSVGTNSTTGDAKLYYIEITNNHADEEYGNCYVDDMVFGYTVAGADTDLDGLYDDYLLVAGVIIFIVVIGALFWIFTEIKKYKK